MHFNRLHIVNIYAQALLGVNETNTSCLISNPVLEIEIKVPDKIIHD